VPGRHDFAVRLQVRSSFALEASIASRTNVRDDAYAPLVGRDGRIDRTASSKRPSEKFCEKPLDTNLRGVPVGQITSSVFEQTRVPGIAHGGKQKVAELLHPCQHAAETGKCDRQENCAKHDDRDEMRPDQVHAGAPAQYRLREFHEVHRW
jgi:hypothetical protein